MMKKIIILMFVLLMTIQLSYAEDITTYDTFDFSDSTISETSFINADNWNVVRYINGITVNDITQIQGFNYMVLKVDTTNVRNMPDISAYDTSVNLYIGSDLITTGIFGYSKSPDLSKTFIQFHAWDDFNIYSYTGKQYISFSSNSLNNLYLYSGSPSYPYGTLDTPIGNNFGFFSYDINKANAATSTSNLSISSDYSNSYEYSYTSSENFNLFYMDRDTLNTTIGTITKGGVLVYDDITLKTTDLDYITEDKTNYTWDISMENIYGKIVYKTISFSLPDIPQTSGTIINNQTSYINPEIILSEIILNEPDYNNYYYRVKVMYEKYSNFYDYAVVTYNQSQIISNDESYYEIDINEDYYDLPTKFKIIVESYNKNSGESVIIGESNIFMYNPSQYYDNIIEGYILDTTTNAYVSNVHIYYNNSLESYYDLTDSNGYFKFYLPTDLYNMHIEKNNYHDTDFSQYIDYSELTKIYITPLDEDINLYGNVLNLNTNLPLSDVKITVNNETFTQFTYSNNYGYYEFFNIQNNTNYTLIAELDNYYSFNELIIIPSDAPKYQLINLIPIIDDIDTDIDQQIEDLKEEIQPIKDLIFGLSEIVIDNPDYNNDNIISENEYADFINSLVSLVIVIFIVIMYIGLKDRREKK